MKGGRIYNPTKGNAWNPLREYPRNMPCFCGSGIKAKKCCGIAAELTVPAEKAAKIRGLMDEIIAAHRAGKTPAGKLVLRKPAPAPGQLPDKEGDKK